MTVGFARVLALAILVVLAGSAPGLAAAPASTPRPAGVTVTCRATAVSAAPFKAAGVVTGIARGSCTMTGSFGAPWMFRLTVRIQSQRAGGWTTRAIATSSIESNAATKRIDDLQAGVGCTGSTSRMWRVQVVAEAIANEKVLVTLEKATAISGTATLSC